MSEFTSPVKVTVSAAALPRVMLPLSNALPLKVKVVAVIPAAVVAPVMPNVPPTVALLVTPKVPPTVALLVTPTELRVEAPDEVRVVNAPVDGVMAPIVVALTEPPVMATPEEAKLFAVRSPVTPKVPPTVTLEEKAPVVAPERAPLMVMLVTPVSAPVTLAVPLKFWPQIVLVVWRAVAVEALPVKAPMNEGEDTDVATLKVPVRLAALEMV